jgi:hypothetical protein
MAEPKHIYTIRVGLELKERIERCARKEHRSVNSFVEWILSQKCSAKVRADKEENVFEELTFQ